MTYFADLTPYTYSESSVPMVNVGWLDPPHEFPVGVAPAGLVGALNRLRKRRTNVMRGMHVCGFCPDPSVTVAGVRYAAPRLVHHYVAEHGYLPPQVFIDAVFRTAGE